MSKTKVKPNPDPADIIISNPHVIRHDIDSEIVAQTIKARIENLERRRVEMIVDADRVKAIYDADNDAAKAKWQHVPQGGAWVNAYTDKNIERERSCHSSVRILEKLSDASDEKRFYLVYGDVVDDYDAPGTGGFDSVASAQAWFVNCGR